MVGFQSILVLNADDLRRCVVVLLSTTKTLANINLQNYLNLKHINLLTGAPCVYSLS